MTEFSFDFLKSAIEDIKKLEKVVDKGKRLKSKLIQYRAEGKIDYIKEKFNLPRKSIFINKHKRKIMDINTSSGIKQRDEARDYIIGNQNENNKRT